MKLEIKHLAPYLPYHLHCQVEIYGFKYNELFQGIKFKEMFIGGSKIDVSNYSDVKPILRQMSDFVSYFTDLFEEDIDVRTFCNSEFLEQHGFENWEEIENMKIEWYPVGLFNLLIKHHFDVFDLLEKGLAINKKDVLC